MGGSRREIDREERFEWGAAEERERKCSGQGLGFSSGHHSKFFFCFLSSVGFLNGLCLAPTEAQLTVPRAFLLVGAPGARFFKLRITLRKGLFCCTKRPLHRLTATRKTVFPFSFEKLLVIRFIRTSEVTLIDLVSQYREEEVHHCSTLCRSPVVKLVVCINVHMDIASSLCHAVNIFRCRDLVLVKAVINGKKIVSYQLIEHGVIFTTEWVSLFSNSERLYTANGVDSLYFVMRKRNCDLYDLN